MRPRKYPLDPLARLREKRTDDAAALLSDAVRARQEAEQREGAALARRDEVEAEVRGRQSREREALERGELRAEDLVRGAVWGVLVEEERAELARHVAKAAEQVDAARGSEHVAREGVARARADAEIVQRDRARWGEVGRKKQEGAEEEAAAEAFRSRPK